jgi:hypothetical protein
LPFFNDKDHCTSDVKPTGDYAADCETDEAYAIEFVKTCDKTYGWASLMQSITSDIIRAGSKNGIVIGFMGVIGSALATVMPKAEPLSHPPVQAGGFQEAAGPTRQLFSCSAETSAL